MVGLTPSPEGIRLRSWAGAKTSLSRGSHTCSSHSTEKLVQIANLVKSQAKDPNQIYTGNLLANVVKKVLLISIQY